jgi:alpha-tubulin suppressor-like RCC1 family protein
MSQATQVGIAMNTKRLGFLAALVGAACIALPAAAGERDFKSETFPLEKNLAVDIAAPGAVRVEIGVSGPNLREDLRYELGVNQEGQLAGGIYIPPGEPVSIEIVALDSSGVALYQGTGKAEIGKELIDEFSVPLEGQEAPGLHQARFGSELLTAGIVGETDDLLQVGVMLLDPNGTVEFSPEDLEWQLPDGFPEIKYSCFRDALCIYEWKPTREQEAIYLCWKWKLTPYRCVKPSDYRGPYKYVAVGQNHTCALTVSNDIRCWGDNIWGQLGAPSPNCGQRDCSPVPIAVQCPAGEVCKFRSVAAGGDHTCAVDTNGKAWCWGEDVAAAGTFPPLSARYTHRRIPAKNNLGVPANLVQIDTSSGHTCAVSAAQDVFCWGSNVSGQLAAPLTISSTMDAHLVSGGNRYKSVTTGTEYSCAVHASNGLADCWGDNGHFQLVGKANTSKFITINPEVPVTSRGVQFMAAGASTTCAQVAPNDDTVCWGKPSYNLPNSSGSPGFVAQTASYARSMATDLDTCSVSGSQDCARICIAALGGELSCGHWKAGTSPYQLLSKVPNPQGVVVISWTQVDVGPNHVCAVTTKQDVWCFGSNTWGQFGTGILSSTPTDKPITAANR